MHKERASASTDNNQDSCHRPIHPVEQVALLQQMRKLEQLMLKQIHPQPTEKNQTDIIAALTNHLLMPHARPTPIADNELNELARQWRELRNQIMQANYRFVASIAKHYAHTPYEYQEALQIGIVYGLTRAIELFDPKRGVLFQSYAGKWIANMIKKHLQKLRKEDSLQQMIETDDNFEEEKEPKTYCFIERDMSVAQKVELLLLPEWLEQCPLTDRERIVLKLRFQESPLTLEECAQWLFDNSYCKHVLTRERIRQFQRDALKKMKNFLGPA